MTMTGQDQQSEQESEDVEEPEADIDESDHADGADIFGDIDPDDDLDDQQDQQESAGDSSTDGSDDQQDQQGDDPLGMMDSDPDAGDTTIGDIYCNGVGLAAASAVGSFGSDDDPRDREDLMQEYGGLARQLELDKFVNDAMAAHGGPENLPPAHAAVMMTVVLGASIAVSEPAATSNLVNNLKTNT